MFSSLILDHPARQADPCTLSHFARLHSFARSCSRHCPATHYLPARADRRPRSAEVVRRRRKNQQNNSNLRCLVLVDASTAVDVRLSFPDRSPPTLVFYVDRALSHPRSIPASICLLVFLFSLPRSCVPDEKRGRADEACPSLFFGLDPIFFRCRGDAQCQYLDSLCKYDARSSLDLRFVMWSSLP